MRLRLLRTAAIGLLAVVVARPTEATDVVIEVSGIKRAIGQVRIALFDSEAAFLARGKSNTGFRVQLSQLSVTSPVLITLHGIAPGRYAATAHHDENVDGKLGKNFLGIPREGYGFSRDAKGLMGPPSFDDAVIEVRGDLVRIPIRVSY